MITLFRRREATRARAMAALESTNRDLRGLIRVHHKLQRIRRLEDGWDGPGSVAVNSTAVRRYEDFLRMIAVDRAADAEPIATSDGAVRMEWDRDKHAYIAEIGSDSMFLCSLAPDPKVDAEFEGTFHMDTLVTFFNEGVVP